MRGVHWVIERELVRRQELYPSILVRRRCHDQIGIVVQFGQKEWRDERLYVCCPWCASPILRSVRTDKEIEPSHVVQVAASDVDSLLVNLATYPRPVVVVFCSSTSTINATRGFIF